jgi:hypothetical protein
MLGFTKGTPEKKIGKKVDLPRLKGEINALSGELKFLKGRVRDPELNKAIYNGTPNELTKEFSAAFLRRWKTRLRFNKLVTLRALMRGKVHFHKNTRFEDVDYGLYKLGRFPTKEDLWKWVEDVRQEFEVAE